MDILNIVLAFLNQGKPLYAFLIVIGLALYYFFDKYYVKREINLMNHSVFSSLSNYNFDITRALYTTRKANAIRGYLKCYVEHYSKWLKSVVDMPWCGEDVNTRYNKMISDLEYCWICDGAPLIWIDKWRLYTRSANEMMYRYIVCASDSEFYQDDINKKLLILTISQTIFFAVLKDMDVMVSELNGELDEVFKC